MAKTSTKNAPLQKAQFFLCEDVRIETSGKLSLMGFFSDSAVLAQIPIEVSPSENEPLLIEGLCVLVTLSGFEGTHHVRAEIVEPTTNKAASMERDLVFSENRTANLVLRMRPYAVRSFGSKPVKVHIEGHVFEGSFDVRRGPPALEQVGQIAGAEVKGSVNARSARRAPAKTPASAKKIGTALRSKKRR
jgi:hypothetical protein